MGTEQVLRQQQEDKKIPALRKPERVGSISVGGIGYLGDRAHLAFWLSEHQAEDPKTPFSPLRKPIAALRAKILAPLLSL